MKKRLWFIVALLLALHNYSFAQELEFTVTIDRQQTPDLPKNITEDLRTNILTFVNNTRWTSDNYSPQERIKCNLIITLTEGSKVGRYLSVAQIQFVRPVYGTTYETVLFTFLDKNFDFELAQGQPLDYNENVYLSNIVSMLSFYTYIALALDYDSFSKLGGSQYIEKAFMLANIAQSAGIAPLSQSGKTGWELSDFNNRMALINNLNNQQFAPFREGLYEYHREALDKFAENPDEARKKIIGVLKKIKQTRQVISVSIVNGSFFLAKKQELINIFSKAPQDLKMEAYNLLKEIDGINSDAYAAILKN
jgi:hypothetical protein